MANGAFGDIEELALCSNCQRPFDDGERVPKILSCKHHFCLACARSVLGKGLRELYCVHCWKRTALPDGRAEALPTHAAVLALARRLAGAPRDPLPALWCGACGVPACRACPAHAGHPLRAPPEARALLARDARHLLHRLQRLAAARRDYLLRALDATTALKLSLEAELAAPPAPPDPAARRPLGALAALAADREQLRAQLAAATMQERLQDAVRAASGPLDARAVRRALAATAPTPPPAPPAEPHDSLLFLANYCTAQLVARQTLTVTVPDVDADTDASESPAGSPARPPAGHPLFYFDLEMDGAPAGRVVIEVRDDVAPRMARNFAALATGPPGGGYRGCAVFQCWENESVITGDFELNNGRGGRSALEEAFFMPDESRLAAVRGAVGMRRSQRRRDTLGLVGSQFRIVLREMRGFTAIFGAVVDGLELVERVSRAGDGAGKPQAAVVIARCGQLN